MRFPEPLTQGTLVRRYKRFLADVELSPGEITTVHCPNPGAMLGISDPGSKVWISDSHNPKRKLRHTLELVETKASGGKVLVGANTMLPNRLAREALEAGRLKELAGYSNLRAEVPYGEGSRIDFLLEHPERPPCFVEVKNVNFLRRPGLFEFPDCKTQRGVKHLVELGKLVESGARAAMLFIVQREDGDRLSFAADLDPAYAATFRQVKALGVEAYALRCQVSTKSIEAVTPIPIIA